MLTLKLPRARQPVLRGRRGRLEPDYLPPPSPLPPPCADGYLVKSQSSTTRPATPGRLSEANASRSPTARPTARIASPGLLCHASTTERQSLRQLWLRLQRVPSGTDDQHLLRDRRGQPVGVQLERGPPRGVQRPAVRRRARAARLQACQVLDASANLKRAQRQPDLDHIRVAGLQDLGDGATNAASPRRRVQLSHLHGPAFWSIQRHQRTGG